jgi:hypothetical protein
MKPLKLSGFERVFVYTCLGIAFQIGLLISAVLIGGLSHSDNPLIGVFFLYAPVMMMVSSVDTSTGCSRMIGPIIVGTPLGIGIYSLMGAFLVCLVKRPAKAD